jgi:DNA repair protein RecO (recombination protein O)
MSIPHKTKAIVLKAIPYGDTSLIVTTLTELFGIQTYIIKGVRKSTKTQSAKAVFFQPAALLEMVVYHNPLKHLNFVKEYKWATIYKKMYVSVFRNAIALYAIELFTKCIKQPDENPETFYFAEDVLRTIDEADNALAANLPLYISIQLPLLLGLQITDNYTPENNILDLKDGCYCATIPNHPHIVEAPYSKYINTFLQTQNISDIRSIAINGTIRQYLLQQMEIFYQLHIQDFGKIKSLPILHEILS